MRILLVNWAPIWDGASTGGGVNGYAQSLALELVRLGHDVAWLGSGRTYVPRDAGGAPGPIEIRRHDDWLGIRVFEVINSPVLAPALHQFRRPLAEVANDALDRRVRALYAHLRPDVVHVHNVEGLTCACVLAARAPSGDWPGARIVYSLHNYHAICPQVYLMRGHRIPCHDFDNGRACESCIHAPRPNRTLRRRLAENTPAAPEAPPPPPPRPPATRTPLLRQIRAELRSLLSPPTPARPSPADSPSPRPAPPPVPMPGHPADTDAGINDPLPATDPDPRGNTRVILDLLRDPPAPDPDDPALQPLTNEIRPEGAPSGPPNDYARRREAMIAMLNGCDRVLAVSSYVHERFESVGVRSERLRTMPIGTRATEIARRQAEMLFEPPPFEPTRPVRLVFLGYNNYFKGLPMLADALDQLTPEELGGIDLTLAALGLDSLLWRFRRLEPRLARLAVHEGYQPADIPWLLGGKDLGVVPSVWWDNAPQTVFEMLACGVPVLGAAVGGIPDFVEDGVNGILFRANDRADLAAKLRGVLADPARLGVLRSGVRPPKGMRDHATELVELYRALLREGSGPKLH